MPVAIVRNPPVADAELNALRRAAWDRVGDQAWGPVLRRSLGWVGATDDGRLVGFVNVAWDGGGHAFLLDTTVHPDHQRRGLGRALVREAAAMARERGAEWLHVDFEDRLETFYRGCGFRPTAAGLIDLSAPEEDRLANRRGDLPRLSFAQSMASRQRRLRQEEMTMALKQARRPPLSDAELDAMVGPDPHRPGPARGRLLTESIPVWAIIGYIGAIAGATEPTALSEETIAQTATDYDISPEAVRAALRYYVSHRGAIDALLEANAAALT